MLQYLNRLFALVIGVVLVVFAVYLDKNWNFDEFHLVWHSREWLVGAREINHMIGLTGFTISLWYFITSFSSKLLIVINLLITLTIALAIAFIRPEENWFFDFSGVSREELWSTIMPIYIFLCMMLGLAAWKTPNFLRPVPVLVISCGGLIFATLVWECYVQPFNNVYGRDPRGWIEFSQVLFDLLGIGAAALIILGIDRIRDCGLRT